MSPLSRRAFLRGLGAGALSLPMLRSGAYAQMTEAPKRLVCLFSAHGFVQGELASGTGTNYSLGRVFDPLEPFRDEIMLLTDLNMRVASQASHPAGTGGFLTARSMNSGNIANDLGWASGESIDHYVAQHSPAGDRQALQLGVLVRDNADNRRAISFSGSDRPLRPEGDPRKTYQQVFGGLQPSGPTAPPVAAGPSEAARRQRVMQRVRENYASGAERLLASEEKQRLRDHADMVRDIETGIAADLANESSAAAPSQSTCTPAVAVNESANDWHTSNNNWPQVSRHFIDITVAAMQCDLTRVVSMMWGSGGCRRQFTWAGVNDQTHSDIAHVVNDSNSAREKMITINRWHSKELAYFLGRLQNTEDVDGRSLLDNTLVIWGSELGEPDGHNRKVGTFVVAGNVNNHFNMGRHLNFSTSEHHNQLYTDVARSFGIDTNHFGESSLPSGTLNGLT